MIGVATALVEELPPRARRIHPRLSSACSRLGTTSACAENTNQRSYRTTDIGNYLRVRGEYPSSGCRALTCTELPPRARRILVWPCSKLVMPGTTSACAENTMLCTIITSLIWNYLRVRGEYFGFSMVRTLLLELPPRARRIPCAAILYYLGKGTTSACAENTVHARSATRFRRNYLRVRGEYVMTFWMDFKILELPPRARRIHKITAIDDNKNGTTSACAENTLTLLTPSTWPRNYLRVRGEYPK